MDEEPLRLCGPGVCAAAERSRSRPARVDRVRPLLRVVGRRLPRERRLRSRTGPASSRQETSSDRRGRGEPRPRACRRGRARSGGTRRRVHARLPVFCHRRDLSRASLVLLPLSQAPRDSRRPDGGSRLRVACGGRRGGDSRPDQPLADRVHHAPGSFHRAQQATARADPADRHRDRPPAHSRRLHAVPARPDDLGGDGVDRDRVRVLHDQPRNHRRSSAPICSA